MKKWKKLLLVCMVISAVGVMTACSCANTAEDNHSGAADQDQTSGDNGKDTVTDESKDEMNNEGGIIEDAGDALQEGVNDVENGVEDMMDGNTGENTMNGKVTE